MNLYLLEINYETRKHPRWNMEDTYISFLVAAATETQAREAAASYSRNADMQYWKDTEATTCQHIGTALDNLEAGVLGFGYKGVLAL